MTLSVYSTVASIAGGTPTFSRLSTRASSTASPTTDAASVSLSSADALRARGNERALTSLSDASSYVSIAQSVTDGVEQLLNRALEIASTLEGVLPATQRAELAEEAESILEEIDELTSNAELNDQPVIDAGEQTFTVNLNASDPSTASTYSITVPNVPVSRTSLSLATLTADDFSDSPTATINALTTAGAAIDQTKSNLRIAEEQVLQVGERFGEIASLRSGVGSAAEAEDLATQIASAVESLTTSQGSIDPLRVQDLLALPTPREREDESDLSLLDERNDERSSTPSLVERETSD